MAEEVAAAAEEEVVATEVEVEVEALLFPTSHSVNAVAFLRVACADAGTGRALQGAPSSSANRANSLRPALLQPLRKG
jgi:hypothetical protein